MHLQGDQEEGDPGEDQGRHDNGRRTEESDRRGERSVQGGALYAPHPWMLTGAGPRPVPAGDVTCPYTIIEERCCFGASLIRRVNGILLNSIPSDY